MSIDAEYRFTEYEKMNATVSVTMTVKEWDRLLGQIERKETLSYPLHRVIYTVKSMIEEAKVVLRKTHSDRSG